MTVARNTPYDAYFAPQAPGLVLPLGFQLPGAGSIAIGLAANSAIAARCIAPCHGYLKDVAIFTGATAAGTVKASVYDASDDPRVKLWSGDAVASTTTDAWVNCGDPDVEVNAGDPLDLVFAASDTTLDFAAYVLGSADIAQLPAGYLPDPFGGDATALLAWTKTTEFTTPSTSLAESALTASINVPLILARVEPINASVISV